MASRGSDLNIKIGKNTQEIHHKASGRLQCLCGAKKMRQQHLNAVFRTHNFGAVLDFVIKFAILVLNIKHQNGLFPEHLAPKSFLHLYLSCTQMAFRPNPIGLHERAFLKHSESGLNSKMVIGTQIGNSQNTEELRHQSLFQHGMTLYFPYFVQRTMFSRLA